MSGVQTPPQVLLVGAASTFLKDARQVFRKKGMLVSTVPGPLETVAFILSQRTSMVVSGCVLPHMNGVELLLLVRLLRPRAVCVLTTHDQGAGLSNDALDRNFIDHVSRRNLDLRELDRLLDDRLEKQAGYRPALLDEKHEDIAFQFRIRRQASKVALAVAQATDFRDRHTGHHSERVSVIAHHLGQSMSLGVDRLADMCVGALLHDLGKIGISEELFSNPGKLNEKEIREIHKHPGLGAWLAKALGFPRTISDMVAQHHENHDGSGYPAGCAGDQIILPARIIRVADAYEAMCAQRSFRSARDLSWIKDEFSRCRSLDFDPDVTDVLLRELISGKLDAFR